MSEEKKVKAADKVVEKKVDYKTGDYLELEFELGDLEFEATGKSKVVEDLFRLLLDKISNGEIPIYRKGKEEEEEEEEEEEKEEEYEEEEAESIEEEESETVTEPKPDWDILDSGSPPESPVEREMGED